jgi:hypothetical protein
MARVFLPISHPLQGILPEFLSRRIFMVTMRLLTVFAMAGLMWLAGSPGTGTAANKSTAAQKKHSHAVHGVVEHVHHNKKDKHAGSFTIRVHHATSRGSHHHDVTFHVADHTKFDFFHGKDHRPATFAALHKGEHVIVHHHADHPHKATKVDIHAGKKGTVTAKATVRTK